MRYCYIFRQVSVNLLSCLCLGLGCFNTIAPCLAQSASGRLEGSVESASHLAIAQASVLVTNLETGIELHGASNSVGHFSFASLPVGVYRLTVSAPGFRSVERNSIHVDIAASIQINVLMRIGEVRQSIVVQSGGLLEEDGSSSSGIVLDRQATSHMPLNGRSFTDLLALQSGVTPATSMTTATVQGLGQSVFSPSGDLNAGALSINGQRESANAYIVNGANAEETGSMAAAIVPVLDSIDEFRILVGNFDAEYGRYSGGQVSVVTRSGSNHFHGDAFEYLRNTALDARNYFSTARSKYQQNQFGGVFGGPIHRDRIFFFADYQQTRQIQGADTGLIPVPSTAERSGDFSDLAQSFTTSATANGTTYTVPTTVSGSYLASLLGAPVSAGEPYYFSQGEKYISNNNQVGTYSHDCVSSSECVFPGAQVSSVAWSAPAKALLKYIPTPNASANEFSTSAYNALLNDGKGALRLDANTRFGRFSVYGAFDGFHRDDPYPTGQGGANIPGFDALSAGASRLLVIEHGTTLGTTVFNQVHLSYTRVINDMGRPHSGVGVSLASQGFLTGADSLGIVPGDPESEGIENVVFNNFTIGVTPNQFMQYDNTYELSEDVSKVWGKHTFKAGLHLDHDEINTFPRAQLNGSFQFYGTETGSDFADFLLGVASQYNQNALRPFYERENYIGAYAEDSWNVRSGLSLSAGVRWDRIEPWWEKYNNAMTIVDGEQSQVFPNAPKGLVFPGDPGIPRTLAPAQNLTFAPRLGIAWTPRFQDRSVPGRLLGTSSVVHAGFGIYYTAIPGQTMSLISDNAPYGFTYSSPAPPLFDTPFMDAATGNSEGQRFPAKLAPLNVSRQNPDSNIDWTQFEPIAAVPGYSPANKTPYAEEYRFSLERKIGESAILEVGYAGNQAHRLLVLKAANPGDPALCLSLSQSSEVAATSSTCGPFGESTTYTTAAGITVNGTREPLGAAFGSVSTQSTIGNSSYHALQANLRIAEKWGQVLAGYTWSKSLDMGSNFGDQVNPFDPQLSRSLSAFDLRQNFVVSFVLKGGLPAHTLHTAMLGKGWELSGIARMSTGFPVTLVNNSDTSLWGTQSNGVNNLPVDLPNYDYSGGALRFHRNPRTSGTYFDTSRFSLPNIGAPGNARRRFFSGPGMENFDMSVQKTISLRESRSISLRIETFNVFNHAQFFGPGAVNGNITDASEFGHVVSAQSPRLMQLSLKLAF